MDIDWGASDRPVLATIDGAIKVYDLHLKICTSPVNNYFTKGNHLTNFKFKFFSHFHLDPIASPYFMSPESALNLRTLLVHQNWRDEYSLQFSANDGFDENEIKGI